MTTSDPIRSFRLPGCNYLIGERILDPNGYTDDQSVHGPPLAIGYMSDQLTDDRFSAPNRTFAIMTTLKNDYTF